MGIESTTSEEKKLLKTLEYQIKRYRQHSSNLISGQGSALKEEGEG
jgi:hypothetical protein